MGIFSWINKVLVTNIHADELYCFYCNKHEQIFNTKFLHLPSSLPGNCSETDPEESFLERDLFVFPCPVRLLWRTINPPIPEQGSKNSIHWIKTVFHSTNESQDYSASASKNGSEILEEFPSGILGNISQFFCLSEYIYNEKWSEFQDCWTSTRSSNHQTWQLSDAGFPLPWGKPVSCWN